MAQQRAEKQQQQKSDRDQHARAQQVSVGDPAMVNYCSGADWLLAVDALRLGPLSYLVQALEKQLLRRHVDYLKSCIVTKHQYQNLQRMILKSLKKQKLNCTNLLTLVLYHPLAKTGTHGDQESREGVILLSQLHQKFRVKQTSICIDST